MIPILLGKDLNDIIEFAESRTSTYGITALVNGLIPDGSKTSKANLYALMQQIEMNYSALKGIRDFYIEEGNFSEMNYDLPKVQLEYLYSYVVEQYDSKFKPYPIEEDGDEQTIYDPNKSFYSKLPKHELRRICKALMERGFIEVASIEIFVNAFKGQLLTDVKGKILWLKTREQLENHNISLAYLLRHLCYGNIGKNYKVIVNKIERLFNLVYGFPSDRRSIENSIRNVINVKYDEDDDVLIELRNILNH